MRGPLAAPPPPPPRSRLRADKRSETRNPRRRRRRGGGGGPGGRSRLHVAHTLPAGPQREQPGPRARPPAGGSADPPLRPKLGYLGGGGSDGVGVRGAPAPRWTRGGVQLAYLVSNTEAASIRT